ncbi:MAG TPA: type II secretion system F family protein [Solirubrobacteraceae bacterium]|jgi:type IV pilus assembly protein PilC|nr:type II secretion system F family protein [Solirubrobacteraceae bacterium]
MSTVTDPGLPAESPPPPPGQPSLRDRLAERGRRLGEVEITTKKVKPIHLMNFCRYLSVFLTAGVPILEALEIIRSDTPDKKLKRTIADISLALRAGDNLSTAVAAHEKAFPPFFVSMLGSAEETGQLAPVLGQIAAYIERDIEAKRKVKSALIYPGVVVVLAIVAIGVLVGFVLPRFVTFFKEFNAKLPLPTRMLIAVSEFSVNYGLFVAIGIVVIAGGIGVAAVRPKGRMVIDRTMLRMPIVAKVVTFAVVERFCRILSSMVQAGVPLPVALDLAATGASNRAFGAKLAIARRAMIEGAGLHGPLAASGMFPPAAVQMMRVGEETGTLEERLDEISTFYGKELEYRLKRLTDLLEPAAVIVSGVLVGFVAVGIISAIYGVFRGTNLK